MVEFADLTILFSVVSTSTSSDTPRTLFATCPTSSLLFADITPSLLTLTSLLAPKAMFLIPSSRLSRTVLDTFCAPIVSFSTSLSRSSRTVDTFSASNPATTSTALSPIEPSLPTELILACSLTRLNPEVPNSSGLETPSTAVLATSSFSTSASRSPRTVLDTFFAPMVSFSFSLARTSRTVDTPSASKLTSTTSTLSPIEPSLPTELILACSLTRLDPEVPNSSDTDTPSTSVFTTSSFSTSLSHTSRTALDTSSTPIDSFLFPPWRTSRTIDAPSASKLTSTSSTLLPIEPTTSLLSIELILVDSSALPDPRSPCTLGSDALTLAASRTTTTFSALFP